MENQIHPEAVAYQPQQQVMYTIQPPPTSGKVEQFNGRAATIIGSLMIVLGILSIALGGAAFGIMASLYFIGSGIWCGFLFIVTGSLGIAAGRFKLKSLIITFMVLSIMIVCTACPTLLIISGTGLASDVQYMKYQSILCNSFYTYMSMQSPCRDKTELLAINALLVMACTVQAILCITSSAYCCRAVCCCCNKNVSITHDHIIGQGHQEVLTMTTSGQQDVPTMAPIGQQGLPTMATIGQQGIPTMATSGQQGVPTMTTSGQQGVPTMATIGQQGVPTMATIGQQGVQTMAISEQGVQTMTTIGQQGVQIMPISDQSDNAVPVPQINATSQQGVRTINIPPGYSITIQPTPEYIASVPQSQAVCDQPPQSWKIQGIE